MLCRCKGTNAVEVDWNMRQVGYAFLRERFWRVPSDGFVGLLHPDNSSGVVTLHAFNTSRNAITELWPLWN